MIIWMDDELFTGDVRNTDLLCLLRNAANRCHTLLISSTPDGSGINATHPHFDLWLEQCSTELTWEVGILYEKLRRITVNNVTRGRSKRVLITNRTVNFDHSIRLNMDDAIRATALPLFIMVENQINDSAFLRRVMPPEWRQRLAGWEKRGEVRFIQGGGIAELTKLINIHASDDNYCRLAFGLPADVWKQLNFIIYDHDGITNSQPSGDSVRVKCKCYSNKMMNNQHRLKRRSQESYLPQQALQAMSFTDQESSSAISTFFALPPEERYFTRTPKFFKNQFKDREKDLEWEDTWFEQDGIYPEMIHLAEKIASAI